MFIIFSILLIFPILLDLCNCNIYLLRLLCTKFKYCHKKTKQWWTKELNELKKEIKNCYHLFKLSDKNDIQLHEKLKMLKKNFRHEQRRNQFIINNNKSIKLNKLLILNKKEFWKTVKRSRTKMVKVEIPIEQLQVEYEKL